MRQIVKEYFLLPSVNKVSMPTPFSSFPSRDEATRYNTIARRIHYTNHTTNTFVIIVTN